MPKVLLVGAAGFVGRHVHPHLVRCGFDVVGGTRRAEDARARSPGREFRHIDLEDPASVERALEGIDQVVYLVHSMTGDPHYERTEKRHATTMRDCAERAGVERIVYLGGVRPSGHLSRHLASRLETGRILRSGPVPVVELRATMIIGGGSESFRIVRDLAARLPWMLLPRWLRSVSEPVAIDDVAVAVAHALRMPVAGSRVLDVPGPETLSGREILFRTAGVLGQRPRALDVPLVSPWLSSHWIRLITRANARVAAELVEGLRSDIVATNESVWDLLPEHERVGFDEAVARALREEAAKLPPTTKLVEAVLHRLAEQR